MDHVTSRTDQKAPADTRQATGRWLAPGSIWFLGQNDTRAHVATRKQHSVSAVTLQVSTGQLRILRYVPEHEPHFNDRNQHDAQRLLKETLGDAIDAWLETGFQHMVG